MLTENPLLFLPGKWVQDWIYLLQVCALREYLLDAFKIGFDKFMVENSIKGY